MSYTPGQDCAKAQNVLHHLTYVRVAVVTSDVQRILEIPATDEIHMKDQNHDCTVFFNYSSRHLDLYGTRKGWVLSGDLRKKQIRVCVENEHAINNISHCRVHIRKLVTQEITPIAMTYTPIAMTYIVKYSHDRPPKCGVLTRK